ncbi:MAG: hypothetical protein ABIH22_04455 [Candidatus Margulisiibacteriota bacterium]
MGLTFPKGVQLSRGASRLLDKHNQLPKFSAEDDAHRLGQKTGLPSILIRPAWSREGNREALRVFVAHEEYENISKNFALPAEALKSAFFVRTSGSRGGIHKLVPIWSELLDPQWRQSFLSWIAGKGGLPSPPELDWETLKGGLIAMPTYLSALGLTADGTTGKAISGRLALSKTSAHRLATFYYKFNKKDRSAVYSLSPDKFERIRVTFTQEETFDKTDFQELFGSDPQRLIYNCSRKAGSGLIGLSSIGREQLRVTSREVTPLIRGTLYYFEFTRGGSVLEIRCYKDPDKQQLHGWYNLELDMGLPRFHCLALLPPG